MLAGLPPVSTEISFSPTKDRPPGFFRSYGFKRAENKKNRDYSRFFCCFAAIKMTARRHQQKSRRTSEDYDMAIPAVSAIN